jgi:hypothetical protein
MLTDLQYSLLMQVHINDMQLHVDRWLLAALLLSAICCSAAEADQQPTGGAGWTRQSAPPTHALLASMPRQPM